MKALKSSGITLTILILSLGAGLFAQTGTWETGKTPMPVEKWNQGSAVVDGKIFIIGGYILTDENAWNSRAVGSIEVYDPISDSWDTTRTEMPSPRGFSAITTLNKKIYVIGGADNITMYGAGSIVEGYDTTTDTWDTLCAPMPTARAGCRAVALDGKIYVAGAWDDVVSIAGSFESFDPVTNQWEILPDLPEPTGMMSMDMVNGKIIVIGGNKYASNGNTPRKTIQIYDPETNSWQISQTLLPEGCWCHGSCLINEFIYMFGGQGPQLSTDTYAGYPIVSMFDMENGIVLKVSDLPTSRALSSVHGIDGKIYVIGGVKTGMDWTHFSNGVHTEVEVYTPAEDLIYARNVSLNKNYLPVGSGSLAVQTDFVNRRNIDIEPYVHCISADGSVHDSLLLYDDGSHGDGEALDGIFGASLSVSAEAEYRVGISSIRADNGGLFMREDAARFSSIGPVVLSGLRYMTADTIPDPGDRISVRPIFNNLGKDAAAAILTANITCLDSLANWQNNFVEFRDLPPGETGVGLRTSYLSVFDDCPDNTMLTFRVDIFSNEYLYWQDTFRIKVGHGLVLSKEEFVNPEDPEFKIYPNPFDRSTVISCQLPAPCEVQLEVYAISGQKVVNMNPGLQPAGEYRFEWDANGLPGGVYFIRLRSGQMVQTKKVMLMGGNR